MYSIVATYILLVIYSCVDTIVAAVHIDHVVGLVQTLKVGE